MYLEVNPKFSNLSKRTDVKTIFRQKKKTRKFSFT